MVARGDYVIRSSSIPVPDPRPKTAKGVYLDGRRPGPAGGAPDDLFDGFEGRLLEADTGRPRVPASACPWTSYNAIRRNAGVEQFVL